MINSLMLIFAQDSMAVLRKVPVGDQINSVIDNIAGKLSVPATKLFEVLARQSYANGVADIVTALFFLTLIIIGATIAIKNYYVSKADGWNGDEPGPYLFTIACLASIILLVPLANYMRDGIMEIMNPQYYAVQFILQALSSPSR